MLTATYRANDPGVRVAARCKEPRAMPTVYSDVIISLYPFVSFPLVQHCLPPALAARIGLKRI